MRRIALVTTFLSGLLAAAAAAGEETLATLPPVAQRAVDFVRDIQPLFARSCYSCHGAENAESSLRLDRRSEALAGGASGPAWEAGKSAKSRLVSYIAGVNEEQIVMPPEGQRLSPDEVSLVRAWIDQGAAWPDGADQAPAGAAHWSFQPLRLAPPPPVAHAAWVRNEIDAFILARLEEQGIAPSPEADRPTLIRRLSLDLLGLPPAPSDVAEFVADARPDAYERVVERLLASPHYGERWGRHWLDLARYADSDGYEKDTARPHAWRYRNWVIDALNRDLPFDQFTIQQLAGDLLEGAGLDERVATGFHRNTLLNKEGGADQEEFRVAATIDRVNTTGTVWLGLTVGCAQCHTHKYDPISQREYYGLFALFNNLVDADIPAPLPEQVAEYGRAKAQFDAEHTPLEAAIRQFEAESLPARQAAWEESFDAASVVPWSSGKVVSATVGEGVKLETQADLSLLASGANPKETDYSVVVEAPAEPLTGIRLEALTDPSLPAGGPGRAKHGNFVLSELRAVVLPPDAKNDQLDAGQPIALAAAIADFSQQGFDVARAIDGDAKTGWAVAPRPAADHVAIFATREPVTFPPGTRLALVVAQQHGEQHTLGRLRLSVTSAAQPLNLRGLPAEAVRALAVPASDRSDEDRAVIRQSYRAIDEEMAKLLAAAREHARRAPVDPSTTTKAQAFTELDPPRATHVLVKGDFLRPGALVAPHVPAVLPPLRARGDRADRLDLARWLVDTAHPLTSRVTVNRVWQRYFGRALVATSNDFGTQGEKPSHPELLDWLAAEFMRRGWSQKELHRLIVRSATYRQSSIAREELNDRDAYNTLLARQNRLRCEAEVVRDLALAAAGLLNRSIGGPSVRPRQPDGVAALGYAGSVKWETSRGDDRYRRGLYTFFQRTVPYPMLLTFDAPDSNTTCTRRERSNTPLQALTLLNDPVFVECAQGLARRVVVEAPAAAGADVSPSVRARHAFAVCLGREPAAEELAEIEQLYARQLALCRENPEPAGELVGGAERPAGAETAELAAWVVVARTLLNLDEFITRE